MAEEECSYMKASTQGCFLVACGLMLIACGDRSDVDAWKNNMLSEKISCPDGALVEISPWGKSGQSRSCKMMHGRFTGWERGRKVVEGTYYYGKEQGEWLWYGDDGQVVKSINFGGNPGSPGSGSPGSE